MFLIIWLLKCLLKKNKKTIVTELFIRGRMLNISLASIMQSYFAVPTQWKFMKIPNKQELQQTAFNHSSDIDFRDFMKFCEIINADPYSYLVTDATLASDNPLLLRKNLLEKT